MEHPAEVRAEQVEHVRVVTIDRPERANALSRSVMKLLATEVSAAGEDPATRVLVLTGAGQRSFCSGADLKEMLDLQRSGHAQTRPLLEPGSNVFQALLDVRIPTIAALNGVAVAGGLELALACDVRVASATARLGCPEAKRGLGANVAAALLPRLVPPGIALEMLFTGELVSAEDAAGWGLVNRVVPPDELMPAALGMARRIAGNAPIAIRWMKGIATAGRGNALLEARTLSLGPDPYDSEDRREGVRAFNEGRDPIWSGR